MLLKTGLNFHLEHHALLSLTSVCQFPGSGSGNVAKSELNKSSKHVAPQIRANASSCLRKHLVVIFLIPFSMQMPVPSGNSREISYPQLGIRFLKSHVELP